MMKSKNLLRLCISSLLLLTSCKKKEPAPTQEIKAPKTQNPSQVAKNPSKPSCIKPWSTKGPLAEVSIGSYRITTQGGRLTATSTPASSSFIFGVIADIKDSNPENLANLQKYADHFLEKKVQAILLPGDIGDSSEQIEEILVQLSETKLPILTLMGNRESQAAYNSAIKAAKAKYPGIIDLNHYRAASFDQVAFISVPGYHNKIYIHARDGCHYTPEDVDATQAIAKSVEQKTRILVSHGPPRQEGALALDRTLEEANVGDPELQNLLSEMNIPFGIFANIHEAGGHATTQSGTERVRPGEFVESFYLNPGPADSVRWAMNDQTESIGMVAVVEVKGSKAQYSIYRLDSAEE
ncbi:MAG: metallophosphoesterase [Myxococcota bacterium]|nr:metallophosphoesterase [Myxococcota bacterium]